MAACMTCDEARERMAHYREGWLGPEERRRLEAHLARCRTCARAARQRRAASWPWHAPLAAPERASARDTGADSPTAASPRDRSGMWFSLVTLLPVAAALILMLAGNDSRHRIDAAGPVVMPMPMPMPMDPAMYRPHWTDLHTTMELAGGAEDPDRAVLLLYAAHRAETGR